MEAKESIYNEVMITYYNDVEKYWAIDAWKTINPYEEGVVVARINTEGEIDWEVEEAKNDPQVKEVIAEFFKDKFFSAKDDMEKLTEWFTDDIKSLREGEAVCYIVSSKDGEVTYGMEKTHILGNFYNAVGRCGNPNIKLFEEDQLSMKEAVEWLIDEITEAVGETFVIERDE